MGDDGNSAPIAAREGYGVWGAVSEGLSFGRLYAVSCARTGDCTAVGNDRIDQPAYSSSRFAPPTIVSFSPASGPAGTVVTIKGTNLDGASKVSFHGATETVTKDTTTTIKVTVPAGATTGRIIVVTHGGWARTATVFRFT